ncbi:hypothetical protein PPL_12240 [Heterostelium album PN500]|uniref:Uncharacterized protein n=1 Tax=Heterostelium pallidum (strain ATCC 26659 / Pp 5 / PN500) TaxID=670386 RepID=D3BM32_HETP5|nr:hypothetical protein PPL_12240 [Heterostelium album PN500]EFA77633.1 hypothetical protein PPL_12240 [Heterostelium album PN500]|eukprot:XP_020429761.1 hypothetical protein PPL_12240 [Heterostelium album PN500]
MFKRFIGLNRYYSTLSGGNKKIVITTNEAPAAIGPYSQAIKANGQIFVSGCLGLDPKTMQFTSETDVEIQTQVALQNMSKILDAAGSSMSKVVKTTILLKDINDFAKVNQVYSKYFSVDPPARSTFAVRDLPKNTGHNQRQIVIQSIATAMEKLQLQPLSLHDSLTFPNIAILQWSDRYFIKIRFVTASQATTTLDLLMKR